MTLPDLGEKLGRWAHANPSVEALVQIGSRVRATGTAAAADAYSDWDFQVVTRAPETFATSRWMVELDEQAEVYVLRGGRLGSAMKVTALLRGQELDLVIIPARRLRLARRVLRLGITSWLPGLRRGLGDLSLVIRPGYRLIKGERAWGAFFAEVGTRFSPTSIGDAELRTLADGFVCDYVSTKRKIERGEFLAAQRWLHHNLAETNFRLLHELRRRSGLATFPDARRLERLNVPEAKIVTIAALPEQQSLHQAARAAADACRALMRELLGDRWRWPDGID